MAQEEHNETNDNLNNPPPPNPTTIGENASEGEHYAKKKTDNSRNIKYKAKKLVVRMARKNKSGWTTANYISLFAVIVSAVLAVFTWLLYSQAVNQAGATQQAANASTVTALQSMKAYSLAKIAADSTDSSNARNFRLQQRSTETQINALRETRNEFKASNRPFIEITDLRVDSVGADQRPQIKFNISNQGRFPAKIFAYITSMGVGNISKEEAIKQTGDPNFKSVGPIIGVVTSSPASVPQTITYKTPLTPNQFDQIREGILFFYLNVEIRYQDFINKTVFYRRELYKIRIYPMFSIEPIVDTEKTLY